MLDLTKLPELNNTHEYLIDNPDYSELYERLNMKDMEEYVRDIINNPGMDIETVIDYMMPAGMDTSPREELMGRFKKAVSKDPKLAKRLFKDPELDFHTNQEEGIANEENWFQGLSDVTLHGDDFYETFIEKINAVSKEDVKRVANKYLKPENLRIIVVGKGVDVALPRPRVKPAHRFPVITPIASIEDRVAAWKEVSG